MSGEREYFHSSIDTDAAQRFVKATKDLAIYVENVGWHVWDGRRWVMDAQDLTVLEYAQDAATAYIKLCRKLENKTESAAKTAANRQHITSAVYLARGHAPKTVKDLDTDPWLLNCLNGTVNLRTGEFWEYSKEDYITKLAPVNFNPEARHPVFDKYLADIAAYSPDLPNYLGRCFGASLTADTSTEKLFLLQGDGDSGKTTLIEAMGAMMGDYAARLPFESFCTSRHGRNPGGASPDRMMLRGARLAYATEGDKTDRLDAAKVKELTGGDTITARALRRDFVSFAPTHHLWLVSNFDPRTDVDDTGMLRRMTKLHFNAIAEELRDPAVKDTLMNDPLARSALLQWCIQGCLAWQNLGGGSRGLAEPESVKASTAEYWEKQDVLAPWWEELQPTAKLSPNEVTPSATLRSHYEKWCRNGNGDYPVSIQRFSAFLERKGLKNVNTDGKRQWRGIFLENHIFMEENN